MDYDSMDRWASKCVKAAIESQEKPFTILEACEAIGIEPPTSEDNLASLKAICRVWSIRVNVQDETFWKDL